MTFPSGRQATMLMSPGSRIVAIVRPLATDQMRAVLSYEPVTTCFPSGLQATPCTSVVAFQDFQRFAGGYVPNAAGFVLAGRMPSDRRRAKTRGRKWYRCAP